MDGRCQEAVGAWARKNFGVEYPDTITIAGVDGVLLKSEAEAERSKMMAEISAEKHGSKKAVIVGHSQCAGNPVSEEQHRADIKASIELIKGWGIFETIIGVYHDVETNEITEVCRI